MGVFDFLKKPKDHGFEGKYVTYQKVYNPPGQHMRILRESMDICMKTVNPDTFFSRERLAEEEASYCRDEPDIVWNGMNCIQIYRMLTDRDKREVWHRQFIDRLFDRGKEDNLTFHMYDARITQATADYFVKRLNGKKYHFCKVGFPESNKLYTYVAKDLSIKVGDSVTIPTGNGYVPNSKLKQVIEVFDASLDELGFPVTSLRCIEEKLKSIVCPHCGASIEINVGEKTGRCTRCQSEFYLLDTYNESEVRRPVDQEGMKTGQEHTDNSAFGVAIQMDAKRAEAPASVVNSGENKQSEPVSVPEKEPAEPISEEIEDEELEESEDFEDPDEEDTFKGEQGTYSWDRFYPDHCNDDVVDMMIAGGVQLVQGAGIAPGDLAEALLEVEEEKNRLKILKDLKLDGYHTQEKDILEYFNFEGDGKVLNEMIGMFTGAFTKEIITEFYTIGTDVKLSDMMKKAAPDMDFTESEIIDILNCVDDSDVAGIKALLARYNPRTMSKDTMIEICEALPASAMGAAKKYLKLLPFADRMEIQDDYF